MQLSCDTIHDWYLDYFNNFLTVARFADYYQISTEFAEAVIKEGKRIDELKSKKFLDDHFIIGGIS